MCCVQVLAQIQIAGSLLFVAQGRKTELSDTTIYMYLYRANAPKHCFFYSIQKNVLYT